MLSAVQLPSPLPRLGGPGRTILTSSFGRIPSKKLRTPRQINLMDLNQMQGGSSTSSRVVMVRKTEQRTFKTGEEPKFETVTRETVETFRGNRSERITTSEKRDVFENLPKEFRDSITPQNGCTSKPTGTSTPRLKTRSPSTSPDSAKKSDGKLVATKSRESDGEGDFTTDCLKAHNEYRLKHGVAPLKLNRKLCKFSEEWAKKLATRGVMEHRQGSEYGENIFCVWNSNTNYKVTGREPVDNWYNEIKNHIFGREPSDLQTGHFTQVVWRDSKELGVAFAKSTKTGQIFVVANYSPPGNYIGSFAENVPPIGGFPKDQRKSEGKPSKDNKASSSSSSDEDEEGFEKQSLQVHNEYRKKHGVPAMKLNKEMCKYARDWAALLVRDNKFCHRTDGKYGENLYSSWSSDPQHKVTAKDVCQSWYAEIKDHTFGLEPRTLKSGHFTQMIWKASTELGIGMARANGRVIIVANYNPRGNYIGQFAANCPRPR